MMPNKNWFHTYRLEDSGSTIIRNDASCKVNRIGNIRIKMFDGVIRMLCDVRYAPDLRNKLISLSTLDGIGYDYRSKSGIMKVRKSMMTVTKGQKLASNIYRLLGTTVVGRAAVGESISDSTAL